MYTVCRIVDFVNNFLTTPGGGANVVRSLGSSFTLHLRNGLSMGKEEENETVGEITDEGLIIITPDKEEETMKADTVVLALLVPNGEIGYGTYQTRDVYMIGDCVQVRRGYAAVHDGYRMGMDIGFPPYQTYHRELISPEGTIQGEER